MKSYLRKTVVMSSTLIAMNFAPALLAASSADCSSPITVKSGDTLSGIAQRCGTSVSALLTNNPQVDESGAVRIGERIYLPPLDSLYSDSQLDLLLGPIALHPDVLLSEMLPASTYPLEIVQAARWRERNPNSEVRDEQDWADSVKALTRYPDVLAQMNEDIEWTQQLGDAFLTQPDAVFETIQRLRRQADAAGHLKDSKQQDVIRERSSTGSETIIRIVHADPLYVHVPSYDPDYVYSHNDRTSHHHGHSHAGVHFGVGLLLGGWLHHTLDWHHGHLFYQPYHSIAYQRYYRYRHYRPYTSYSRNYDHYGRSPYRGLRWRHGQRHYNDYGRHGQAKRHYYSGRSQERYRNRYNRNGSYIVNHRLRNFSEPVEQRRDQRRQNEQHDNQTDRSAAIGGSNRQGNGDRNQRRRPDMNTRAWKGDSASRGGRAARDGALSRQQRRATDDTSRQVAAISRDGTRSPTIANTSRRFENTTRRTEIVNRSSHASNSTARTSRSAQRPQVVQQARSQQRVRNQPSQVRQQRVSPPPQRASASRAQPRVQNAPPQRRQEKTSRRTNQR